MAAILSTRKRCVAVPNNVAGVGTKSTQPRTPATVSVTDAVLKTGAQKFDEVKDLYATDQDEYIKRMKHLWAQLIK